MSRGTKTGAALLIVAAISSHPRPAHADNAAACIAASEAEVALRKQGKLHEALRQLTLCSAPGCPAEVTSECERRAVGVNAAMPTIVIGASDGAGNDLTAVAVTLDGAKLATSLDGRAVAVDPGSHTLHFETPGRPPVDKTFVAREDEKGRRVDAVLSAGGAAPLPGAATASAPPATRSSHWSTQKTLALVSGAVGVVGLGVGATFFVIGASDASDQHAACGSSGCANHAAALTDHSDSMTAGNVATAMFIVGGAGIAGAIALWLTAPRGERASAVGVAPLLGGGVYGVGMTGRFE